MKVKTLLIKTAGAVCAAALLASCQTTKNTAPGAETPAAGKTDTTAQTAAESQTVLEPVPAAPVIPEPTPAEKFLAENADTTLSVTSVPAATVKHKAFSKPYKVSVTKHGAPAADYRLVVSYPVSKDGDIVFYEKQTISTGADGIAVFTPGVPEDSFNTHVTFMPAVSSSDPEVVKLVSDMSVEAPWKVSTDYKYKGGIISVMETDARGSPFSSKLLMDLVGKGFANIGNGDFTREIKTGNQQTVYKAAKNLAGGSVGFLIYGTVKPEGAAVKTADGYAYSLTGEIYVLDMKTGRQLYKTIRTVSVTDAAQWKVLDVAKDALASELAEAVLFGM